MSDQKELQPQFLSSSTLIGDPVTNSAGEDLGVIEEIMIDLENGQIAYAVLSFGGFLGIRNKLFVIPWGMLAVDTENEKIILDVDKEALEDAPGFDKDNWPTKPTRDWLETVYVYYEFPQYW